MWLADLVTAVIGVLFLTAPFSPQFNSSPAVTWTYLVGGALFLLLGVLTLNWDEYRRPWYLHLAALIVGAWFVLAPFGLLPMGREADNWPLIIRRRNRHRPERMDGGAAAASAYAGAMSGDACAAPSAGSSSGGYCRAT